MNDQQGSEQSALEVEIAALRWRLDREIRERNRAVSAVMRLAQQNKRDDRAIAEWLVAEARHERDVAREVENEVFEQCLDLTDLADRECDHAKQGLDMLRGLRDWLVEKEAEPPRPWHLERDDLGNALYGAGYREAMREAARKAKHFVQAAER